MACIATGNVETSQLHIRLLSQVKDATLPFRVEHDRSRNLGLDGNLRKGGSVRG